MSKLLLSRPSILFVLLPLLARAVPPGHDDPAARLQPEAVVRVAVHLPPWQGGLDWQVEVPGDDPRARALAALVREADPRRGHRCANVGVIRFFLRGGGAVGVGLLGSHDDGPYALRLHDGDELVAVRGVDRGGLFAVLEDLGVPEDATVFQR